MADTIKKYLPTEETHARIATALETLNTKNFESAVDYTIVDEVTGLKKTHIFWRNGNTNSGTNFFNGRDFSTNEVVDLTNTRDAAVSELITRPIIFRFPMPALGLNDESLYNIAFVFCPYDSIKLSSYEHVINGGIGYYVTFNPWYCAIGINRLDGTQVAVPFMSGTAGAEGSVRDTRIMNNDPFNLYVLINPITHEIKTWYNKIDDNHLLDERTDAEAMPTEGVRLAIMSSKGVNSHILPPAYTYGHDTSVLYGNCLVPDSSRIKSTLATEETHVRIAAALEKLADKNFGNVSEDTTVSPYEFATQLTWSNGTTTAPNVDIDNLANGGYIRLSFYSGNSLRTDLAISETITKPIILRVTAPQLKATNTLTEGLFTFISCRDTEGSALRLGSNSIVKGGLSINFAFSDNFDFSGIGYVPEECFANFVSGTTVSRVMPAFRNIIAVGTDTETTPLKLALQASDVNMYIYVNPLRGLINVYWGTEFDKAQLLGSYFIPNVILYRENDETFTGSHLLLGTNASASYSGAISRMFVNGYDTSATGGNIIVPNIIIDDGFSMSRLLDGSITTF